MLKAFAIKGLVLATGLAAVGALRGAWAAISLAALAVSGDAGDAVRS